MITTQEVPLSRVAETLEEVTSTVGFTMEEIVPLLMAGLRLADLLYYAQSVASGRVN